MESYILVTGKRSTETAAKTGSYEVRLWISSLEKISQLEMGGIVYFTPEEFAEKVQAGTWVNVDPTTFNELEIGKKYKINL